MILSKPIGRITGDDMGATIWRPMVECDICKAEIEDANHASGYIGCYQFRIDYCRDHTEEELRERIQKVIYENSIEAQVPWTVDEVEAEGGIY
jgi:hypothetical protein